MLFAPQDPLGSRFKYFVHTLASIALAHMAWQNAKHDPRHVLTFVVRHLFEPAGSAVTTNRDNNEFSRCSRAAKEETKVF